MYKYASNATVDAIGELSFEGNVIPHSWYKNITKTTPKGGSKPDTIGIVILADIIYWYRPTIIRDESTGKIVEIRKKFKADKLQRSYEQVSEQFGFSKRQVRDAIYRLKALNLLTLELRNIVVNGVEVNNVLYIEPVPESIKKVTFCHAYDEKTDTLLRKKVLPPTKNVGTNTEITTEITEVQNTGEKHAESFNANQEDIKKQIKCVGDPVSLELAEDSILESDVHVGHLLKESKHLTKTQEKFGNKNVPALIENWEQREGRSKRSEKTGMKVKTSPKNSNTIIAHFNELFNEFFGGTPPIIVGKDNALIKKMITHYGFDYVDTMMFWMFKNWGKFVREKKITGIPSIGILWGYKLYFQEKVSKIMESSDDSEW